MNRPSAGPGTIVLHLPDGPRELPLGAGVSGPLSEVLAARGFPLNTRCGGRGLCRGCEVEWRGGPLTGPSGTPPAPPATVRACQCHFAGGTLELFLPPRSLLQHQPEVVSNFRIDIPRGLDPLGPGSTHGAAVDIGTTTVALLLVDLRTGAVVGDASAFNAQIRFGEDVLTRIQACSTDPAAVGAMQRAVVQETIQPLLREACAEAGVAPADVGVMTIAANTTMQHLVAGVDPSPLGVHPFRPVFLGHRRLHPAEVGLEFGGADAELHLLPGPAAYVGADLAAGIVATGLLYEPGPSLLVDVGTNGEIIAKVGDRLLGCATAAGPAFEGAGLTSGMRAVRGSIERIRLRGDPWGVELGTIGDTDRPLGLCGSAYVDFLAEGRSSGLLLPAGRFDPGFLARSGAPVEEDTYGKRLQLHPRGASGPVWVSEVDVARLLQAKAAIAAGIETLLRLIDCRPADVRRLHLAGGFGMHLSLSHALGCGLLPGFHRDQIEVVGNTSLAGALLALTDRNLLDEMVRACAGLEEIELNLQPGFEDAYIDHLALP